MSNRAKYEAMTSNELDHEAAIRGRKLQAWTRSGPEGRDWGVEREQTIKNLLADDEAQGSGGSPTGA